MKTLVTGASGFVGREACAQLIAGGHEVVALVRREGSQPEGTTPARGVTYRRPDGSPSHW